jgi:hypothetical protein
MTHFRAVIGSIEHKTQRYDTVGDWRIEPDGGVLVVVSRMSDQRYEFLVALHELIEAYLCKHAGISEGKVTAFDKAFETARKPGDLSEPGDDPAAPYHDQHKNATVLEVQLAAMLGVDWAAYSAEVESK